MKLGSAFERRVRSSVRKGKGSSRSEGLVEGYVMDEELQISSRSDFVPEEVEGSMEGIVSLVEQSCVDL